MIKSSVKKEVSDTVAGKNKSQIILDEFKTIPTPTQFNDFNFDFPRIIDADAYNVTQEEIDAANAETGEKKKSGFGKFMKSASKQALGEVKAAAGVDSTQDNTKERIPAIMKKYIAETQLAPNLVGKWYGYNKENKTWDPNATYFVEQASYGATQEEVDLAKKLGTTHTFGAAVGEQLIGKTFLLVNYMKYRSYASIIAEAQAYANAVGSQFGSIGALASQAAGAAAGAIAGDGYCVEVNSYLYQLQWDKDIQAKFDNEYYNKPIEELVASGICTLKYLGKDKANARVRQAITNKTSEEDLIRYATINAINKSITKLQAKFEAFRTFTPITEVDEANGVLYAKIGEKEGLVADDEFEIVEIQQDPATGEQKEKVKGTVKVVKNQIWNNLEGAEVTTDNSEQKDGTDSEQKARELGKTQFKGKVKGTYPGELLRLKKKKK